MYIKKIILENFRQYEQIDLAFNLSGIQNGKNITIIEGVNGAGKTTLLNSIAWCLYGKEKHKPMKGKETGLPLLTISKWQQMAISEKCKTVVRIEFITENSDRMIYERSFTFTKNSGLPPYPRESDTIFEIYKIIDGDAKIINNPELERNRFISENLSEYFFFDGERLDSYFAKIDNNKIKHEVHNLANVDVLERAIKHLIARKRSLNSKIKSTGPNDIVDLTEKIEKQDQLITDAKEALTDTQTNLSKLDSELHTIDTYLKNNSATEIQTLQKTRKSTEIALKELEKEKRDKINKKNTYLLMNAPSIFLWREIENTQDLIKEREDIGEIPPQFKKDFIEKLITQKLCICGCDLNVNNLHLNNLRHIAENTSGLSNISNDINSLNGELNMIIFGNKKAEDYLLKINSRFKDLTSEILSHEGTLEGISLKLQNSDLEGINAKESKRVNISNLRDKKNQEIGRYRTNIEKGKKELDRLERKRELRMKHNKKLIKDNQILNIYTSSIDIIKDIEKEIMDELRQDLESQTKENFLKLIWKKLEYTDVKIDDKYSVSVIHSTGYNAFSTLSAGERQVLALAFMIALNKVSNLMVPIIIDTPFGRISKDPRLNVARDLSKLLENKQVIILPTDEEYTDEVRHIFSPYVSKELRIKFIERESGSIAEVISYE